TFSVCSICGAIFGMRGAGGRVGRFSSIFGINEGNSGSVGGEGRTGICGIATLRFALRSMLGGIVRSGSLGNGIFLGTKLNFGNRTSIPRFICDKSIFIFGILKLGIGSTGKFMQ